MNISNIKINGMTNPIGFDFKQLNFSFDIDEKPIKPLELTIYEHDKIVFKSKIDYRKNDNISINFICENEKKYDVVIGNNQSYSKAYFITGTNFDCDFITLKENIYFPVIFKKFKTDKKIKEAYLYITGLGLYQAYINNQKVGNEFLTPSCNDYDAYLQYQTYEIKDYLKNENEISIYLGDGWYKGRFGLNKKENIFGSKYLLALKILIIYEDDERLIIRSDDSFKAKESFVKFGNIYDGEIQDYNSIVTKIIETQKCKTNYNVVNRLSLPIIVKEKIKPELLISNKNEYILDFKQNFAGFLSFKDVYKKGTKIYIQFGEVLQDGCFFRDNYRTAKAEFTYISDGINKDVFPLFTFYGFRYAKIEGLKEVDVNNFVGNVLYSDLEQTVHIKTSNEKINRLIANSLWSQKSNFIDVPTDCPQRDERLGWTGDAEVFSRTAMYQMNTKNFYLKYLKDMRVDQLKNGHGAISNYSPSFNETNDSCSVWRDAATIIPWNLYEFYGDINILIDNYNLMKDFVENLIEKDIKNGNTHINNYDFELGDWLSQDGVSPNSLIGATNVHYISTAYYYNSVNILYKTAKILGYENDKEKYRKLKGEIKKAFIKEYYTSSGRLAIDTETAYVVALMFDLYPKKKMVQGGIEKRLMLNDYKIKGGFVGATNLIQMLIKANLDSSAFYMLFSERFPGWLHCVNLGATTIWERWNSLNPDGKVSGVDMNSFNHYSYGNVCEAIYGYIVGLRPLAPGFKKVLIEPKFNYRLKSVDFSYKSISGKYVINYSLLSDNNVKFHIEIPMNTKAILVLNNQKRLLLSGKYNFIEKINQNICNPFSKESKIIELKSSNECKEAIKEISEGLMRFLFESNLGFDGYSLTRISKIGSLPLNNEIVEIVDKKLKEIKIL